MMELKTINALSIEKATRKIFIDEEEMCKLLCEFFNMKPIKKIQVFRST